MDTHYEACIQLLKEKLSQYHTGDPNDPTTLLGPLARLDLRETLHQQVSDCITQGAQCLLGGTLPAGEGYYYPATLLTGLTPSMPAYYDELFGPVVCIFKVSTVEQAITLANDSRYGLGAAVFSQDLTHASQVAKRLKVGVCAINQKVSSAFGVPFGGIKSSGFGRELGQAGLYEFANQKTILGAIDPKTL